MPRRSPRLAALKKAGADAKTSDEHQAKKDTATKSKAKPSRRRSRSPSKSCSLQSLNQAPRQSRRIKAQKKEKAICKAPKKSKAGSKKSKDTTRPPLSPITKCTNIQRVAKSPAVKPKRNVSAVTPQHAPKSKGVVKFNLNRNSIAEYKKENPPNIVEHLISEVDDDEPFQDEGVIDDDETKINEGILGEWESSFDELCDDGGQRISRRRVRRVSMLS